MERQGQYYRAADTREIKGGCVSCLCHVAVWGFDNSVAEDNVSGGADAGAHGVKYE